MPQGGSIRVSGKARATDPRLVYTEPPAHNGGHGGSSQTRQTGDMSLTFFRQAAGRAEVHCLLSGQQVLVSEELTAILRSSPTAVFWGFVRAKVESPLGGES